MAGKYESFPYERVQKHPDFVLYDEWRLIHKAADETKAYYFPTISKHTPFTWVLNCVFSPIIHNTIPELSMHFEYVDDIIDRLS